MGLPMDGLRFPGSQTAVWLAEGRMEALDLGLDFYAPQTALAPDGRRILIAWMHSWDHEAPTHRLGHLWANTMTLPRELSWENGKLLSRPAREVRSLRRDARAFAGEFHAACPNACELEVEFAPRPGGRLEICLLYTSWAGAIVFEKKSPSKRAILANPAIFSETSPHFRKSLD